MKKIILGWLIFTILIAGLLRLVWLDRYPVGVSGDEIQQAYSAYSIAMTGRDEWGEWLPLFPRGFGDYKPPLLMYVMVPFVGIFGLSEFVMRVPTALAGIALVVVSYFFVRDLFKNQLIALASAALLAISPWHIQLSRTAFEGGIGLLLMVLGCWGLIHLHRRWWLVIATGVVFGIALYSYHSFRLYIPLLLVGFWVVYFRTISWKRMIAVSLITGIFFIPLITNGSKTSRRLADVSIWNVTQSRDLEYRKIQSPSAQTIGRVFDSRYVYLGERWYENYLAYFSLPVFFSGNRPDNNYLNFPTTSLMYPIEIVTFFVGIWLLLKKYRRQGLFIGWLLLTAPLAASITSGGVAINRAIMFLPWMVLVSSIGVAHLFDGFRRIQFLKVKIHIVFLALFVISAIQFIYYYVYHLPFTRPERQRYAVSQIFQQISTRAAAYDSVVISHSFGQPQMFVAFFQKINPE